MICLLYYRFSIHIIRIETFIVVINVCIFQNLLFYHFEKHFILPLTLLKYLLAIFLYFNNRIHHRLFRVTLSWRLFWSSSAPNELGLIIMISISFCIWACWCWINKQVLLLITSIWHLRSKTWHWSWGIWINDRVHVVWNFRWYAP